MDKTAEWVIAGSLATAVAAYCIYLYYERQDANIRMKDHQWFMDQAKVSMMERGMND